MARRIGSAAPALVALAALAGGLIIQAVSGTSSPAGDDDSGLERFLRNVDDSRRLFVLSQWLIVAAHVATLVAVVSLANARRLRSSSNASATVIVSALSVWAASGIAAAAARAQLVRYDFSIVSLDALDDHAAFVLANVADYVVAFGLVAFVVAMGWIAYAVDDRYAVALERVRAAAGLALVSALPSAIGSAFPSVRDGRVGDTSAFRPGTGFTTLFLVGWFVVLVAVGVAEIQADDRLPTSPENGGRAERI